MPLTDEPQQVRDDLRQLARSADRAEDRATDPDHGRPTFTRCVERVARVPHRTTNHDEFDPWEDEPPLRSLRV